MTTAMPVGKQWFTVCVVVCMAMVYLYSLSDTNRNATTGFLPVVFKYVTSKSFDAFIERSKHVQNSRIEMVRNVCRQPSVFATSKYNGKSQPTYYSSPSYNFTFCKVPKCGSTFWTQALEILNNGIEHADEVFTRKRLSVHYGSAKKKNISYKGNLQQARVVLVSRDPYSRLFSAYIDKLYIPQMSGLRNQFRNESRGNACVKNVSFQRFLEYIVSTAFAGKTLNKHWAPISTVCRPCEYDKILLIKQETFSSDVEYALKVFNVDVDTAEILLDKLHGQRPQSTVPGIIETVYIHMRHVVAKGCFSYYGIAERIWRSFQIQGFLKDTVPFPKHIHISDLKQASYLSEVIMDAIAMHPMSPEDQRAQRRAALVDAYRKVNKETIQNIQQVYKVDFAMFDYSEEPPLFEE